LVVVGGDQGEAVPGFEQSGGVGGQCGGAVDVDADAFDHVSDLRR
jgi:hypothetical protein